MFTWIQLNLRYIKAVNSCDRKNFIQFFDEMLDTKGAFTQKRYIWNLIRGREFYKNVAYHVVTLVKTILDNPESTSLELARVEQILSMVMKTEKNESVKSSFIWNITKQVPLITVDTIRYMSPERITNIITSEKRVANDERMDPFIREIIRLKIDLRKTELMLNDTVTMLGDN